MKKASESQSESLTLWQIWLGFLAACAAVAALQSLW